MRFTPFAFFGSQSTASPDITPGSYIYLNASNSTSYNGTGNTWNDLSGNGLNGNWYLNADYSTSPKKFLAGVFAGSNPRGLNISGATTPSTSPLTVNVWVRILNLADFPLFFWSKSNIINGFFGTITSAAGSYKFGVTAKMTNGTVVTVETGTTSLAINTWYYFSTTWQPAVGPSTGYNLSTYVNGTFQASTSGPFSSTYTNLSGNGTSWYSARYGDGQFAYSTNGFYLGQYEVYKSALTATQILNNFNATKSNYGL
jgi:hypothetical protein